MFGLSNGGDNIKQDDYSSRKGKWKLENRGENYTPIKHWHTFQLDALPTLEEFLSVLEPKEED